jgi:hypothetical protein
MHKGIILLVKTTDREKAISKAKEFLAPYHDDVWDWYAIGGRWTQTLCPFAKAFQEKAKKIINPNDEAFIGQSIVDQNQDTLQAIWKEMGGKDLNPHCNHYHISDNGQAYDVLPLCECIEIVKKWQQTIDDAKKVELSAKEWLAEGGRKDKDNNPCDDWRMYAYILKNAANLYQQNFFFECNVFNTEKYDYSIPEDVENYFAVMIDIHN